MDGASQMALVVKNPTADARDARDTGLIPRLGRSPGGGQGNPLQYSCLKNPMNRGTWRATVHSITESDTTEAIYHTCGHMDTWIQHVQGEAFSELLLSVCLETDLPKRTQLP